MLYYAVSNLCLFLLRFRQFPFSCVRVLVFSQQGKVKKPKHAHMKMEIDENATKTNTN
jgi:hypothetical protein